MTCKPLTIVVTKKDERVRLEMVPRGIRTTETGRLEEVRTESLVREYWVQATDGTWHRLSAGQFRAAEVNQPIETCQ